MDLDKKIILTEKTKEKLQSDFEKFEREYRDKIRRLKKEGILEAESQL